MLSSFYRTLFAAALGMPALIDGAPAAVGGNPVVTVVNGSYGGFYNAEYHQDYFLGIPYAQPPVNDLRFRVPKSLNETWPDIQPALAYPPFCVGYGVDDLGRDLSEDCLYLNVVRPSGTDSTASLPVAVWIHGGGLFMGGTNDARYNLSYIIDNSVKMGKPMIGVSIQYRLSGWGFLGGQQVLSEGIGNLGLRDQRLALHWLQENVAAFGGSPEAVTIWGESAGGLSVGSHLLAYNGRDDKLFRGAIAESGGPAINFFPAIVPSGYNSTEVFQSTYDSLVSTAGCNQTLDTLACLRAAPFQAINDAFNGSVPYVPIIDGDFVATYPTLQLDRGDFVKVPLLIGANTEEGTDFGTGYGPMGLGVNTNEQWLDTLARTGVSQSSAPAKILSALYPNNQALGVPSLTTYPQVITSNSTLGQAIGFGLEFRRVAAYFGDLIIHAARRASNHAWSTYGVPSYSFRFDVTVNGKPQYIGATHFQEVAFVFGNVNGGGYTGAAGPDPFGNLTAQESDRFMGLAKLMSRSWVSFITTGSPNNHGVQGAQEWPRYDLAAGGGAGKNIVWTVNGTHLGDVEADTYRGEGIAWINNNRLAVYGV